jgi:hypothetical protein
MGLQEIKDNIARPLSIDDEDVKISEFIDREIISKLDSLENNGNFYKKYSEIYMGGVYALRKVNRQDNPDWMSQSANSFREIFYLLTNKNNIKIQKILNNLLSKSLTKKEIEKYKKYIESLYSFFSDLTHHFLDPKREKYLIGENYEIDINNLDEKTYFTAVKFYKEYLKILIVNAIDIHKKIDECIKKTNKNKELVSVLLNCSKDSRMYFFHKASKKWIKWLWEKGFLADLNKPANDTKKYSYNTPELDYLERMAKETPGNVAKIILSVKISKDNFNPEVIDRFLRTIEELPATQIKRLSAKIRNEGWTYLMRDFSRSGYGFSRMMKTLVDGKHFKSILELAGAIFETRDEGTKYGFDKVFCINHISTTGVFDALANMDSKYSGEALKLTINTLGKIIKKKKRERESVFRYEDYYTLDDADIFTIEFNKRNSYSHREDIENIVITIKKLIEKTIGVNCLGKIKPKNFFKIVNELPDSYLTWRLKLFALSQCPKALKEELEVAFLRIFNVGERYVEIERGAEYYQLLKCGFKELGKKNQREYIRKAIEYFGEDLKDSDKKEWRKRDANKIFYFIRDNLSKTEQREIEEKFGFDLHKTKYEPVPSGSKPKGGFINNKSPEDIEKLEIDEIIEKLRNEFHPKVLLEKYKNDDFLNPRGAEGLGDALKNDIKNRTDKYFDRLNNFFERDVIHPHYLNSVLRGVEDMMRNGAEFGDKKTRQILDLFFLIASGSNVEGFKKEDKGRFWLADWIDVHRTMSDVLLMILGKGEKRKDIQKRHRKDILKIIKYLLSIKASPSLENENYKESELFGIAINSVRGVAYQAFVFFTENDGNKLKKESKEIFKDVLFNDDLLPIRFLIGHYLATFYFRDRKFISSLFPEIFPKGNPRRKDIYLATWEGYLNNTLYDKLFSVMSDYYEYAINLSPTQYTKRKYLKDIDEALAVHLALAFVHLGLEMDDDLFVKFWSEDKNTKRHKEFVSFIGRSCLSREQASDEWLKEKNVSKDKLIKFWDWTLKNITDEETLSGFGFWINPNKEILEDEIVIKNILTTLEKSDGKIDWDYSLTNRLSVFAEKNQVRTMEIIRRYLLNSNNELNQNRDFPFFSKEEVKEALSIIYVNGDDDVKQKVNDLIATLIDKGNSIFWELEDIVRNEKERKIRRQWRFD